MVGMDFLPEAECLDDCLSARRHVFARRMVWFLIRTIKGFMLAIDGKPVPDPETWLW